MNPALPRHLRGWLRGAVTSNPRIFLIVMQNTLNTEQTEHTG